jgi:hypothetical protein
MTRLNLSGPFMLSDAETRDALNKIGTLCHNRSCTRSEFLEYGGTTEQWRWLRGQGYIFQNGGTYFPTPTGWAAIANFA